MPCTINTQHEVQRRRPIDDCLNQTTLNTLQLLNLYQSRFHVITLLCLCVCFLRRCCNTSGIAHFRLHLKIWTITVCDVNLARSFKCYWTLILVYHLQRLAHLTFPFVNKNLSYNKTSMLNTKVSVHNEKQNWGKLPCSLKTLKYLSRRSRSN